MTAIRSCVAACMMAAMLSLTVGCSMDPPANGVQIHINQTLTDAQLDTLKDKLKALDSGITSSGSLKSGSSVTLNYSPVADVDAFATKAGALGTCTVNGNVITLEVNVDAL